MRTCAAYSFAYPIKALRRILNPVKKNASPPLRGFLNTIEIVNLSVVVIHTSTAGKRCSVKPFWLFTYTSIALQLARD